jgi:hypothetical protein
MNHNTHSNANEGAMLEHPDKINAMTRAIIREIVVAMGLPPEGWLRRLLEPLFWQPAHRFTTLFTAFNDRVALYGLSAGARWLQQFFVRDCRVYGAEKLPAEGPLLVASNHPGGYDSVLLTANLRDDLRILASGVPFTLGFPAVSEHLIFVTPDPLQRMTAILAAIRHLQAGGAVLTFATGLVDPDPASTPGSEETLQTWSKSLEIFLRKAPQTQVVPAIVSGILSRRSLKTPLLALARQDWEKRKLAEIFKIIQLMVFHRPSGDIPCISFGQPFRIAGLDQAEIISAIIAQAGCLLAEHRKRNTAPAV